MKELISGSLQKVLGKKNIKLKKEEIENILEIPPNPEMGDYAFPCFALSKQLKKSPAIIAEELKKEIKTIPKGFQEIKVSGPYLNFFLDKKYFSEKLIKKISSDKNKFGASDIGKGKKIVVEFSSPNIAKPFGIGHLRSTIIGNSVSNICSFVGYKTIKINYLGDWGTQFGKLIFGWKKFGDEQKLKKDSIKHLLEIYVKANKEEYEDESREWFRKLEEGNKEAITLWKKFREISLKDFEELYKIFNIGFDVYSGESLYSKKTNEVLEILNKKNLTKESDGALIIDLEEYGLGIMVIRKSDKTTIYALRDIAAAIDRYEKYKFEKMFYEVGQEQSLHFKQVFKVLELMGHEWAKDCVHIAHGLYLDEDRKKFATRKGKTIFMKDILDETFFLAKKEIEKRSKGISKKETEERALKIAIAGIFYGDLKSNRLNNIVFDIKKFVSFEGDTGPYLQYSYARASSIIRKIKKKNGKVSIAELEPKEFELIKKISEFPDIVLDSYRNLNPSVIANYSYQLAQIFNEFYHVCPVIGSEQESFRVALIESFRQVLKNSLSLLGIEVIEEM
jgi:arginyl-tRNA synthetase